MADLRNVGFPVQDRLIEVRNTPALRNVKLEEFRELFRGLPGNGVAPGAKRDELLPGLVKSQIAMHHRAETNRANPLERSVVLLRKLGTQLAIAGLQTRPNFFQAVSPNAVFVAIFPLITAGGQRLMSFANQHRLNPRRPKLNTQRIFRHLSSSYCLTCQQPRSQTSDLRLNSSSQPLSSPRGAQPLQKPAGLARAGKNA